MSTTQTVADLGHDRGPTVYLELPMHDDDLYHCTYESVPDDDQDKEIPAEARECRHEWVPTDLADYNRVCRHCGKLSAPDGWHE